MLNIHFKGINHLLGLQGQVINDEFLNLPHMCVTATGAGTIPLMIMSTSRVCQDNKWKEQNRKVVIAALTLLK